MAKKKNKKPILVKNSVTALTRELVENDTALSMVLAENIVNISALARKLESTISARLGKKVNVQAIISALKRIRETLKIEFAKNIEVLKLSSLSVRTDLAKISIKARKENAETMARLMLKFNESIMQISWSPTAYTIVFDEFLMPSFTSQFKNEDLLEMKNDLAAVIIHSPEKIIETPGCVSTIISKVALSGINIEDVVSTYTYTLLLFKREDASRAFHALNNLISELRKMRNE